PASQPIATRKAAAEKRSKLVVARADAGSVMRASKRTNSSPWQVKVASTSTLVVMSNTLASVLARETTSEWLNSTCMSLAASRNFSTKASQPVSADLAAAGALNSANKMIAAPQRHSIAYLPVNSFFVMIG